MDTIIAIVLAAIPTLPFFNSLQDWRKSKKHWYLLPALLFLSSIFSVIADWGSGLMATLFSLIVYVIVGRTIKKI